MRILLHVFVIGLFIFAFTDCKNKLHKGFSASESKKVKKNKSKSDINDCEVLEKKRSKKERQAPKKKKSFSKEEKSGLPKDSTDKLVAKKDRPGQLPESEIKTEKSDFSIFVKIGLAFLLALAAIGFVVTIVVVLLVSVALSIILIPLIISFASFLISGIGFLFLQFYQTLQRRRKRRKRRKEDNNDETDEDGEK
ncbi:MAG: hypothetical protein K2X86_13580 [Cytophagaceae bacterium]|nr:hypothetical protein [Cytophagaceae bacterium]